MIRLTAGNKKFIISKENLKKSEYFNSFLSRWNHDDIIELDEDPNLFKHFLNCLRYPNYEVPEKYKHNIGNLFEYYGVVKKQILWIPKYVMYQEDIYKQKGTDVEFKFNGKLLDLSQICCTDISVQFNGQNILYGSEFIGANRDKYFSNCFKELEGEFIIKIHLTNTNSIAWIFYSEKSIIS